MSRKHKSRKPKITQSNVPAAFAKEKKLGQDNLKNETLPEKNHNTENHAAEHSLPQTTAPTNEVANANLSTLENAEPAQSNQAYSLDAHYAAQEEKQEKNEQDAARTTPTEPLVSISESPVTIAPNDDKDTPTVSDNLDETATSASLTEYEQLKRKNRRRLVGAGALVLVAGSLFAAASKDNTQGNPKLSTVKSVEQQVVQPEILRPAGSENQIDLSMDDEKGTPLVLRNNTMSASQNRSNANNTAAQNQNRNNNNHSNTQNSNRNQPANTVVANNTHRNNTPTTSSQSSANERTKAREEARLAEERRKKAHGKAAEAEARRQETERTIANKAKTAQAAADRNRNAERAQLTAERAAQEKQRAQRQAATAAASAAPKSSNGKSSSIQAGAFSDREAARRMQQQLKNLNYAARVEEVQTNKGKIYRVRTGDFSNEADAKSALNKLQNKGVNGMVVGK